MALDKVLYQEGAEDHRGKVLSAAAGGARGTSNQFNAGRANHIHFNCIQDARNIQSTSVLQGIFKSDSNAVFTNRFSSTLRHLNTRDPPAAANLRQTGLPPPGGDPPAAGDAGVGGIFTRRTSTATGSTPEALREMWTGASSSA